MPEAIDDSQDIELTASETAELLEKMNIVGPILVEIAVRTGRTLKSMTPLARQMERNFREMIIKKRGE